MVLLKWNFKKKSGRWMNRHPPCPRPRRASRSPARNAHMDETSGKAQLETLITQTLASRRGKSGSAYLARHVTRQHTTLADNIGYVFTQSQISEVVYIFDININFLNCTYKTFSSNLDSQDA